MITRHKVLKETNTEYKIFHLLNGNAKNEVEEESKRCERKTIILLLGLVDRNIGEYKIDYNCVYDYIFKKYGFDLKDKTERN